MFAEPDPIIIDFKKTNTINKEDKLVDNSKVEYFDGFENFDDFDDSSTKTHADSSTTGAQPTVTKDNSSERPYFGEDGLLVEQASERAQNVINLLEEIPGHMNGASYHQSLHIDELIDELSVEECVWILHRIEDGGFGQTGDGYAGQRTPESHQVFMKNQIDKRYNGSIKELLKHWGTYSYGGY